MQSDTAIAILKDLPNYWSEESVRLKPEFAKQLLEYGLIEEVEPGRYRNTSEGTYFVWVAGTDSHAPVELKQMCPFTYEECDITQHAFRLETECARHAGRPDDPESINAFLKSCIGKKAI